jgi:hypothetical protein
MCDNAAKTVGFNHLKHTVVRFHQMVINLLE